MRSIASKIGGIDAPYVCPCSDHPFKLISSIPLVKHISEVYDQLSLGNKLDIYALTSASLQDVREGRTIEPGYITRKDGLTYHRSISQCKRTVTNGDPLYILMEPCVLVRGLRDVYYPACIVKHCVPQIDIRALITDFRYDSEVWYLYTEAMMHQFYTASWPSTMAAAMLNCAEEELRLHPVYDVRYDMDECDIHLTMRRCSRVIQDQLMCMHVCEQENIWTHVPKDVIKIIHRLVFAGYIIP
jgi:hypothetical protein